jgi:hypothetical protein
MAWFEDERLKRIYEEGIAEGVPSEDCFLIRRSTDLLLRMRGRISFWVAGKPFTLPNGRSAVRITPQWAISFEWFEGVGPLRMRLEG